MNRIEVHRRPELDERCAATIADAIEDACAARGRGSLALSGGTTPARMLGHVARLDVRWESVDVFQVDERVAPRGDADRNLTMIERELGERLVHEHSMPVEIPDLEAAADRYAHELEEICGRPPVIDVVHLGLGPDGHTASLVPDDPVLDIRDRWVAPTGPYEGHRRLTLTFPVLDAARLIVFLVTEPEKAPALERVLEGDISLPAGRLKAGEVVFFVTPEASGGR